MFIPAKELQGYRPHPGDVLQHARQEADREAWGGELGSTYTPTTFWENKKNEADARGLTASIREKGVVQPVNVFHPAEGSPRLGQGHHRTIAADPESLVPVRHFDNIRAALYD